MRALELGAIDFVAKPANGVDLDMESVRDELLRKVKIAAKVRVVRNAARRPPLTARTPRPVKTWFRASDVAADMPRTRRAHRSRHAGAGKRARTQ